VHNSVLWLTVYSDAKSKAGLKCAEKHSDIPGLKERLSLRERTFLGLSTFPCRKNWHFYAKRHDL